ncbi:MAG: CoA synthetase [Candidatus Dormibacteraeota bacterium]|nr:CoA synthetase [Candidatus Dormibacteraeota bacterium]
MAVVIAREVLDAENVGIGVNSPIPAAGVLLARRTHAPRVQVRLRGIADGVPFIGSKEFFDLAQRGRLDLFFLSGIQIDRIGRINMHEVGGRRFPGAFGSAVLYPLVRRVILFRTEHSPRVFVPEVQFATAAGRPHLVVTSRAVLAPDPSGVLELVSWHPWESADSVRSATGWDLAVRPGATATPEPTEDQLALLRGPVYSEMEAGFPEFVAGRRAQAS